MENNMMKALVFKGPGKLCLTRRPIPTIQEPGDAIVKVTRSTICTSDLHIRNGAVPRAREGVILGHEFAGEIVETGTGVKGLKTGDRVAANCETGSAGTADADMSTTASMGAGFWAAP